MLNCHAQLATNKGKGGLRVDLDVNRNCMVILSYSLTLKISLLFSSLSFIHSYNFSFGNFMLEQLNRAIPPMLENFLCSHYLTGWYCISMPLPIVKGESSTCI